MIAQSPFIEAYGTSIYFCLLFLVLFSWWLCEGCPIKLKNEQATESLQKQIKEAFFFLTRTVSATLLLILVLVLGLSLLHSKYGLIYPQELIEAFTITICLGISAPLITISLWLIMGSIFSLCHNYFQHRRKLRD